MQDKLGRKVSLREDSRFANSGNLSNRTGFIGVVYAIEDFDPKGLWYRVVWETKERNAFNEEDLLWYDYMDDWKDVARSWGGSVSD